jgi:hypothetical protein
MAKTYDNNDPTPKFPWMQLLADNNGTLTENGKIFNNMSSYDNSYYHNTQDRIQVNHYISQQGIHLQQTFDLDGIVNSYDMAPGDYMEYNVEVPAAGQFNLFVRYSVTEESKLSVQSGSTALAAPVLPALESKHWATKKYTVTLTAGKQKIRLTNTQGANIRLNWFRLSQDANAEQEKIDEELPGGEEEQQPGTLYHLAKDKPVEASSQQAYGNRLAKFAVDGLIDDNRWGTEWEGSNIDNSRWFLVDLGETKTIKRIDIYWEAAYATAYHIEVSDDKQNWTEIYRTTSGTFSNEKLLVNGQGRYVRFQCDQRATQYGVSFFEFAVWDNPEGQGGAVDLASKDNVYLMQTADRYIVQSQQPVQTMRLYNAKGQVVAQSNSPVISHNCLSQGIYFLLAVNNKGEKTTFKVIKK